MNCIVQEAVFV